MKSADLRIATIRPHGGGCTSRGWGLLL